jgi:hypothetical protein
MCFNGHKNWVLGWYNNGKVTVNPKTNGAWVGNLVTFVDYSLMSQVSNSAVLINVADLYIQLNSAKKFNIQTMAQANKVTIVQANSNLPFSYMLAGLGAGQSFTYANFNGTGIALTIQVCSIQFGTVDYARVSIYLANRRSRC